MVVARGVDGTVVDHGVMENTHADHILDTTVVPAAIADTTAEAARKTAHRVAEGLDLVGVLCVELFDTGDAILVNEIAPRPHNSGHCTIEAAAASQFEQQLRAVTGQPLGDGSCAPAAMAQLPRRSVGCGRTRLVVRARATRRPPPPVRQGRRSPRSQDGAPHLCQR